MDKEGKSVDNFVSSAQLYLGQRAPVQQERCTLRESKRDCCDFCTKANCTLITLPTSCFSSWEVCTSQTFPRSGRFWNKETLCLGARVSVPGTQMKLGDGYSWEERLEIRSLKEFLTGPWGEIKKKRLSEAINQLGSAVEFCTNWAPLFNASVAEKLNPGHLKFRLKV